MDDIIGELLDAREDNGNINIKTEELVDKENFRRKKSEEMYNFIDKVVHPRSRKALKNFIERYTDAYSSYYDCEAQLYYKAGFSDAIQLIFASLQ